MSRAPLPLIFAIALTSCVADSPGGNPTRGTDPGQEPLNPFAAASAVGYVSACS